MGNHLRSPIPLYVSRLLALLFLFNSIPFNAFADSSNCKHGECVSSLINNLEDLGNLYKDQCLPKKSMSDSELTSYHEKQGISEECWKLMTEINHLEDELRKQNANLEAESLTCDDTSSDVELNKLEKELSCNEQKKSEIKSQCGEELKCVLAASALGFGGYIAEKMAPAEWKPKNCHLGDDGCGVQLATAFLKAVVSFFEGAWDLLKAGGKYVGKKAGEFWDWVKPADDHASTSQLAMAKASEDPGVFDMLMKDFPGTMAKIFEGLIAALKEWFKTDVFCQKWEGVPHFSKCVTPTDNFDCLPCKTMATGLCSMTGTLVAEIIPAFLTGGMVTAAKHGVNGASKIAKVFNVTAKAMEVMKASKVGRVAIEASTKLDNVLRISRGLKLTKTAINAALAAIKAYLHSPTRKILKSSQAILTKITTKGGLFLVETKAGKVIVFSASALKTGAKVIIYPIDNHLTTWAYKAGERTFEKIFKLGAPRLAPTSTVASAIIKADPELEKAIAKLEVMKNSTRTKPLSLIEQEEKVLELALPKRKALAQTTLGQESADFNEIISHLYPELGYGSLARKIGPEKVLAAEKELLESINKMPDGPAKDLMLKRHKEHTSDGVARNKLMGTNNVTSFLKPHENINIVTDAVYNPVKLKALNVFIEKARASGIEINQEFVSDLNKIHITGVTQYKGLDPAKGREMALFLKKYPKVKRQELLHLAKKEVGVLGKEEIALVETSAIQPVLVMSPKQHFNAHYGIESARGVEALGLPTSANNRAYLSLHQNAGKRKVVVFNSETTVLKDGNDILGRETMTAAENMYQETFMDVLRHDESGEAIWKSMARTDAGVLREIKLPLSQSSRNLLIKSLKEKGTLSITQTKLLEKLEAQGLAVLSSEETALFYRMFPDKMRDLSIPISQKQGIQFQKMLDDLGKDAPLTESEKLLKQRLTKLVNDNKPMNLMAEEVSILDGMSTRIYSGFKSVEGAVDWDTYKLALSKKLTVAPDKLDDATVATHLSADLAKFDGKVKASFSARMEILGYDLSKSKGKMSGKRIQNYSEWKAMGVSKIPPDGAGSAIDEAAMASRAGRASEGKSISTYNDAISASATSKVKLVEGTAKAPGFRQQFVNSLNKRGVTSEKLIEEGIYTKIPDHYLDILAHKGPRPQYVVSEKIWSVVRKSDDVEEITKRLNSIFPFLKLTKEESKLLRSQYEALDSLSPAIHAEARGALPVSLGLRNGGVLDVQGLGALNAQWNDAASLVSSLNGKTDDASFIISAARSAEVSGSTPAYKLRIDSMVKTVEQELGPGWSVRVSGDDVVFYPESRFIPARRAEPPRGGRRTVTGTDPPTEKIFEEITEVQVNAVVGGLDRLAKKGFNNIDFGGSSLSRSTFVRGAGAEEVHITMLETLEKSIRKNLEADVASKAIGLDTLSSTVIGFDALIPVSGKATIRVVIPKNSSITSEMLLRHLETQKVTLSKTLSGRPFEFKIDRI